MYSIPIEDTYTSNKPILCVSTSLSMRALCYRIHKKKEIHFAMKTRFRLQLPDKKFNNLQMDTQLDTKSQPEILPMAI